MFALFATTALARVEEAAPAPSSNPYAPFPTAVCVPKQSDDPNRLASAVHWACKYGNMGGCDGIPADCHGAADKVDGKYTYQRYATWVFSKYWSARQQEGATCNFNGQAYMTNTPDNRECVFPGAIGKPGAITPPDLMLTKLMASDSCMDAADQKIWKANGSADFEKDLSKCGNQCLGGASCTTTCIKKIGYTEACSTCFGDLVGCTKDNCMFDCMMDAQGSSCKSCVDKSCTPAFETCSGLTPPSN